MIVGITNRQIKHLLIIACVFVYVALFRIEQDVFQIDGGRSLQNEMILATMKGLENNGLIVPNVIPSDNTTTIITTTTSPLHRKETSFDDLSRYDDELPPIRAIVTGLEYSGSSIIAKILYNAPCMIGAPETGFLVAKTPADIEEEVHPWIDWNQDMNRLDYYMLSVDDIDLMKHAKDFTELYNILRDRSPLFNEIREDDCSMPQVIDHTPRYIYPLHLDRILSKASLAGVPVIVTKKSFEELRKSWAQRGRTLYQDIYNEVYDNVEIMRKKYPHRITIIDYDDNELFSHDAVSSVMQNIFHSLSLRWDPGYLNMEGLRKKISSNPKYSKYFNVELENLQFQPGSHKHFPNVTEKVD